MSFGSAGQRRNEAGWSGNPSSADWSGITNTTRRGFTGHEHLDNLNLIHMNGRVYDPAAGRFLSPDPFIDGALNTQGWNRYAYVHNNPLSYSDPSGFGQVGADAVICADNASQPCGEKNNGGGGLIGEVVVTGRRLVDILWDFVFNSEPPPSSTYGSDAPPGGGGAGVIEEITVTATKNWLCKAGNSVAEFADKLGNVSGKLELTGLGAAGVGFATAQSGLLGVGLALAATGGTGNIGASVFQFSAGLLQGVGGGGYSNSGNAALSLVTGFALSRGILGPATSGYRTFSQRAADQFANGTATVVGGVNDLYTSLIDAAAPKQVSCPGGN